MGYSTALINTVTHIKKSKIILFGFRILWITSIIAYMIILKVTSDHHLLVGQVEEELYKISNKQLLKDDKIFHNYNKSFNIINFICGSFLIFSCLVNILFSINIRIKNIKLSNYKKIVRIINLNLQVLIISLIFMENFDNQVFFCNLKEYLYWFQNYNNKINLFVNSGNNLCIMHKYANFFSLSFLIFSLIEFFTLYINTEKPFRKKFFIFYIKISTAFISLALFYFYLKNKYFFNNVLSKYNIFSLENFNESIKVIILSTQKQKTYYFQLLIFSTFFSGIFFLASGLYDLCSILKSCKFFLLVSVLISVCAFIIILSQLLFSTYILEESFFFCSYKEYVESNKNLEEKSLSTLGATSDITETNWFCNLKSFLFIYFVNIITGLIFFIVDFFVSVYLVFSKKYTAKYT
ncbi:conserved Plasmodium protein, unknown function [Plasmodium gallinaceum]|uniref:Uncharacterized protein n=1 Tax=Plasmodium gallinaceum TaxID=5849 RepID=A0A1J1GV83_PLAGA|nr:conserved Plasmodium protein, unknown function [Plasmodium gallinaceum]CRG96405.1 conserved Plasmodium protein, unknown function [Plasmodium gallinaceum]